MGRDQEDGDEEGGQRWTRRGRGLQGDRGPDGAGAEGATRTEQGRVGEAETEKRRDGTHGVGVGGGPRTLSIHNLRHFSMKINYQIL